MTPQEIVDAAAQVRELDQEVADHERLLRLIEPKREGAMLARNRLRRDIDRALYYPEVTA